jgi:hypothetical protein
MNNNNQYKAFQSRVSWGRLRTDIQLYKIHPLQERSKPAKDCAHEVPAKGIQECRKHPSQCDSWLSHPIYLPVRITKKKSNEADKRGFPVRDYMYIHTCFPPLPRVARYNPVSSSTYPFESANSLSLRVIIVALSFKRKSEFHLGTGNNKKVISWICTVDLVHHFQSMQAAHMHIYSLGIPVNTMTEFYQGQQPVQCQASQIHHCHCPQQQKNICWLIIRKDHDISIHTITTRVYI